MESVAIRRHFFKEPRDSKKLRNQHYYCIFTACHSTLPLCIPATSPLPCATAEQFQTSLHALFYLFKGCFFPSTFFIHIQAAVHLNHQAYCLLKTYSPTRQMPTPISLCGVIGSRYRIQPTASNNTASTALCKINAVLTGQPALYA